MARNNNRSNNLISIASKLWPRRHSRYQEMCVLAASGQLGGSQMSELNAHIAKCHSCRKFLESVSQVSVQVMPLLAEVHGSAREVVVPKGMRDRFLARLASEEPGQDSKLPRPYPFPGQRPVAVPASERKFSEQSANGDGPRHLSTRSPVLLGLAAAAVICAVIGYVAFRAGKWPARNTQPLATAQAPGSVVPAGNPPPGEPDRVGQLERQRAALEREVAKFRQDLSSAEDEKQSLRDELAAAKERLAALTAQVEAKNQDSSEQAQAAQNQVASLQNQVDGLAQRLAESDVKSALQKQAGDELASKLDVAQAELQQERDLKSAKSELGDVVAARNLHIVDVYDADPNGKRQRSFGRVFYIEGKSLVFYAYDLDDPGRFKANVVFHVWGGKAGVKEVTHSLGILRKDDASQNRWAMTFDDPNVLAQINSVFVTAESANKQYEEPHGKKVLYAYFGSPPNHP